MHAPRPRRPGRRPAAPASPARPPRAPSASPPRTAAAGPAGPPARSHGSFRAVEPATQPVQRPGELGALSASRRVYRAGPLVSAVVQKGGQNACAFTEPAQSFRRHRACLPARWRSTGGPISSQTVVKKGSKRAPRMRKGVKAVQSRSNCGQIVVKLWSNRGQIVVQSFKSRSNCGQIRVKSWPKSRPKAIQGSSGAGPPFAAKRRVVKQWPNSGQTVVKQWSGGGGEARPGSGLAESHRGVPSASAHPLFDHEMNPRLLLFVHVWTTFDKILTTFRQPFDHSLYIYIYF
jgi:hypothetical protein